MPNKIINIAGRTLTLDARPDRIDLRDLPYYPPPVSLDSVFPNNHDIQRLLPAYKKSGLILDQGAEGACTGFGLATVINFLLWTRSGYTLQESERVSPRMLYHLARFYDEWPGEDYEGSSCRGALKGWHRHGVCVESLWPYRNKKGAVRFLRPQANWDKDALSRPLGVYYRINRKSVVDIQAAIFHTGAVYVSADVHAGWEVEFNNKRPAHNTLPVIKPVSKIDGGHAFSFVGYNNIGFIVQNSWGTTWGNSGFAILTYEDWVENGSDAWVVALGAPVSHKIIGNVRVKPLAGKNVFSAAGFPWPDPTSDKLAGRKGIWTEQQAYQHTIVTGNDGYVINRLPHVENETDNIKWVCYEQPLDWFNQHHTNKPWRIAVYAHGGLNSEEDSITRIRVLGSNIKANDIYPIFTTWKSGWCETIGNMIADSAKGLFGDQYMPARGLGDLLVEASDRAIEVIARQILVKSMWSEMKENVTRSVSTNSGLDLIAKQLGQLDKASKKNLEIHLIGHSAGSFVCGRLLSELNKQYLNVKTCTLYAPACDLDFALKFYKPAIDKNQLARTGFRIHLLTDELELDDAVGPYRKSLLYLVSRALERRHKTPILGFACAFDGNNLSDQYWHKDSVATVKAWQKFFWNKDSPKGFSANGKPVPKGNLFVLSDKQVNTGPKQIKSSHGCFDNSIDIVTETLQNILGGKKLKIKITDLSY